jgi:hypothetical protein
VHELTHGLGFLSSFAPYSLIYPDISLMNSYLAPIPETFGVDPETVLGWYPLDRFDSFTFDNSSGDPLSKYAEIIKSFGFILR